MSRSIFPTRRSGGRGFTLSTKSVPAPGTAADDLQGDDATGDTPRPTMQSYLDRVQNYIPAEIIAFFIFVNSLIGGTDAERTTALGFLKIGGAEDWVGLLALALGLLACWLYAFSAASNDHHRSWKIQAFMWTIAFLIWIYAIDAKVLAVFGIKLVPSLSGLMLAAFTLFSGMVVPKKDEVTPTETG
jgi:hypothetical protein